MLCDFKMVNHKFYISEFIVFLIAILSVCNISPSHAWIIVLIHAIISFYIFYWAIKHDKI